MWGVIRGDKADAICGPQLCGGSVMDAIGWGSVMRERGRKAGGPADACGWRTIGTAQPTPHNTELCVPAMRAQHLVNVCALAAR